MEAVSQKCDADQKQGSGKSDDTKSSSAEDVSKFEGALAEGAGKSEGKEADGQEDGQEDGEIKLGNMFKTLGAGGEDVYKTQPFDGENGAEGLNLSDAVSKSSGSGSQGASSLSLGGGGSAQKDMSEAQGHQVLVAVDDAMGQDQIENVRKALEGWKQAAPGLDFIVKSESELTQEEQQAGGLFVEAVKSDDIDGNKGLADIGGGGGSFAHVRTATDISQDEVVETWAHEIGHGLGLEHNLSTGETPLADKSVMSDNDVDKSKDAALPTVFDASALMKLGYGISADPSKIDEL